MTTTTIEKCIITSDVSVFAITNSHYEMMEITKGKFELNFIKDNDTVIAQLEGCN